MTAYGFRRGNPTPEEIAIAISVLHAAAGGVGAQALPRPRVLRE